MSQHTDTTNDKKMSNWRYFNYRFSSEIMKSQISLVNEVHTVRVLVEMQKNTKIVQGGLDQTHQERSSQETRGDEHMGMLHKALLTLYLKMFVRVYQKRATIASASVMVVIISVSLIIYCNNKMDIYDYATDFPFKVVRKVYSHILASLIILQTFTSRMQKCSKGGFSGLHQCLRESLTK